MKESQNNLTFLVLEKLLFDYDRMSSHGIFSNQCPIFLLVEKDENIPSRPFKFNPIWLEDEEFVKILKEEQRDIFLTLYKSQRCSNL
jgi:hypothetical protein